MTEIIYSIYLITNLVNGKKYVGFTKNEKHRFIQHKSESRGSRSRQLIHQAIRKYGEENFSYDIICQSKDYNHLLSLEPYFINKFKAEYNIDIGGKKAPTYWKGKRNPHFSKYLKQNPYWEGKRNPNFNVRLYKISFEDGTHLIIDNLLKFCRDNNYIPACLTRIRLGKQLKHKDIIDVHYADCSVPQAPRQELR